MNFLGSAKKLAENAYNATKNLGNNLVMDVSKKIYPPPETPQFEQNGKLSPQQFTLAGDKLTQVCSGWKWMPSSNPHYTSKYLNQKKQYLILQQVPCKSRLKDYAQSDKQQKITDSEGNQIIVLSCPQYKEEEAKKEDYRCYTMYIIYDEHYHTPRMYFSATDYEGRPVSNNSIREDVQKQYLDATLTPENFPFIEDAIMPTVHPCKHAAVLKTMSDAMRENGLKVDAHFALFVFLKFITSVIPNVEFDITGELPF